MRDYYYQAHLSDKGRCSQWFRHFPEVTKLVNGKGAMNIQVNLIPSQGLSLMPAASMTQNQVFRRALWWDVWGTGWEVGLWSGGHSSND